MLERLRFGTYRITNAELANERKKKSSNFQVEILFLDNQSLTFQLDVSYFIVNSMNHMLKFINFPL